MAGCRGNLFEEMGQHQQFHMVDSVSSAALPHAGREAPGAPRFALRGLSQERLLLGLQRGRRVAQELGILAKSGENEHPVRPELPRRIAQGGAVLPDRGQDDL
eukprot:CAMPEP_0175442268 /NCGR_PEP_ID=MMETSP0095-20121207/58058_1 /TAXON_ID=311494 /ORGANISM="Alexandrium monilatum, Strain CCMP3105" /LENGTH=102 /DNA_ID=CAMNT_0016742287 /DNA_START=130 /DNA_END=434 /DNA_ORIENTATION=-